jgi:protein-tyrosine phosphatase
MSPLVDTHCHLLAGLDDGPRDDGESLAMCRDAWEYGTRTIAATAHVGDQWPDNTPERIRQACRRLVTQLQQEQLELAVYPCSEVMITPDVEQFWYEGRLLGMADGRSYLLMELPLKNYFDIRRLGTRLLERGTRPILAHPERTPEILFDREVAEGLIEAGWLFQATTDGLVQPGSRQEERAVRAWVCDGLVHLVASDGHSPFGRPPNLAEAYLRVADWAGEEVADRLCGTHGLMVMQGMPLPPLPIRKANRSWVSLARALVHRFP